MSTHHPPNLICESRLLYKLHFVTLNYVIYLQCGQNYIFTITNKLIVNTVKSIYLLNKIIKPNSRHNELFISVTIS